MEQIMLQSLSSPQPDCTLCSFTFSGAGVSVSSSTMSCSTGLVPWVIIKGWTTQGSLLLLPHLHASQNSLQTYPWCTPWKVSEVTVWICFPVEQMRWSCYGVNNFSQHFSSCDEPSLGSLEFNAICKTSFSSQHSAAIFPVKTKTGFLCTWIWLLHALLSSLLLMAAVIKTLMTELCTYGPCQLCFFPTYKYHLKLFFLISFFLKSMR